MPRADKEIAKKLLIKYQHDPVAWVVDVLGANPWDKQMEILESVAKNKRTSVRSCHGAGKTKTAAWAVLWYLHTMPKSVVITTAPTWTQVENQLWREIRSEHAKAKIPLGSKVLRTKMEIDANWYAIGLSTDKPGRFQGYHAEDILVVVDEASDVPEEIFQAVEGFMTSKGAKMLLIGNPNHISGEFYRSHHAPEYNKIHISCYDTPNFQGRGNIRPYLVTPEWVEEKRAQWGEESPLFQIKCLGEFPTTAIDCVLPIAWLRSAREATRVEFEGKKVIAVDVARFGDDRTVAYVMEGTDIIEELILTNKDTMYVAGAVHILARKHNPLTIAVDVIGVGAGVADRLREMGNNVLDINSAARASDSTMYQNLRAEMWWEARKLFQEKEVYLSWPDEELLQELSCVQYAFKNGKVQIEGKEDVKRRLGKSPDKADAYIMGLYAQRLAQAEVMTLRYERVAQDYVRSMASKYAGF
jgi:hypothetical protein